MRFVSVLAAVAAFAASALAQQPLAFTTLPSSVTAGKPFKLTWSGGDSSPVTVTLKKGDPKDLQTIAILTGSDTQGSYVWTPSKDLPNGNDYALSISQGPDTVNYSGEFSLTGGKDEQATIVVGPSTTYSLTLSSSASTSGTGSGNATTTTVTATTTTPPLLTGTAPGASGTGASVSRNTTFSSATLSSTHKGTASSSASRTGSASGSASGSATGSAAAASSSAAAPRAHAVAQGAAFGGLGALVALMAMF